ncbi:MAG: MarR family winged helix-turn-helix transcriptional regulator [Candidatus Bathyarchaeota archaeon]|jgi:DNA-binding MarR family transcriptional regulator
MSDIWKKVLEELNPETSQFRILVHLAFKGSSFPSQIAEETGISPGTVRPALRALYSKKFVTQERDRSYKSRIAFADIISDIYANYLSKD